MTERITKTKIRLVSISAWTSSLRNWNRWQRSLTVMEVRTVVVSSHANVSNMHGTRRQTIKVKMERKIETKIVTALMFSHSDNLNPWIKCHGSNTLIYISDKEHVVFLSFLWTYNFSCQIKQSQGDMRLEIYYYLEYRRFSSFPILQQTNKTLVSLLSFN